MSQKRDTDIKQLKLILVGMSGTGKANLINVLVGQKFQLSELTTTTATFVEKEMVINEKKYKINIWDTAGQEKFHSLTKIFIKESKIVLFVYDITSRRSFEELNFWVDMVKEVLGDKFVIGLAGNKKDLFLEEKVSEDEGKKKAEELGAIFKLTSAKTGYGIKELIEKLLKEYIIRLNKGEFDDEKKFKKLDNSPTNKKKKCCK